MAGIPGFVFNRLLLIAFLCVDVAFILYFFYWNRLIAYIITLALRLLYADQGAASIWVEIGSIHFSIISGRLLLKDVRYHSSNQTVRIVKTQISWRYWIRRPTAKQELASGSLAKDSERCRIQVSLHGFEWFLYNRTPAYDNIINQMQGMASPRDGASSYESTQQDISQDHAPFLAFFPRHITTPQALQNLIHWFKRQLPYLDPKDVLPVGIDVIKGKIICGNLATPNLLVAEFTSAEGKFGITQSRSRFDYYKQVISFRFKNAVIRLVHNDDYKESMTVTGERIHQQTSTHPPETSEPIFLYTSFHKIWKKLRLRSQLFNPREKTRHQPATPSQRKKSTDYESPYALDFSIWEYAIERKVIESSDLELCYYTDVVGEVPSLGEGSPTFPGIGNGPDTDPEWGIDLVIHSGVVRYGPWADRQRSELQRVFFPSTFHDNEETPLVRPGDSRVWTRLQVFVELRGDTTLQIPFREPSKNWMWDGKSRYPKPRVREAAYIHLSAGDMSSITYIMPMIANSDGYESRFEVHLDGPVITSSLNDIKLVVAESLRVRGELPAPLKWNAERQWTIGVSLRHPVLYLLRDHINMFTDLGKDWTSGPPTQHNLFVPTIYLFDLEMYQFELNLYVNDQNIIDKPLVRDENALLRLRGPRFKVDSVIPSNRYRPDFTDINFSLEIPGVTFSLFLPRWHAHALYSPESGNSVADCSYAKIDGLFRYYSEVREENIDHLKLNINLRNTAVHLIGWTVRYFMVLRENYLGSFTHFSTLYEYLDRKTRNLPAGDPVDVKFRPGHSNIMQCDVGLMAENVQLVLPAGLSGLEKSSSSSSDSLLDIGSCAFLAVPELQLQLRLHDYFMEMSVNVDTISGYILQHHPEIAQYNLKPLPKQKESFVLDGIDITANRLFGPQPKTSTYLCVWEIQLGSFKALLPPEEARILGAVGTAFKFNFVDAANIPAAEFLAPDDPDITFLKVRLSALDVTLRLGQAALAASLPSGLYFQSNDLARDLYRKVVGVKIPEILVQLLLSNLDDPTNWYEAASLRMDGNLDVYNSPLNWIETAEAQREFVAEQDRLTDRVKMMFREKTPSSQSERTYHRNGLHLPQPLCVTTPGNSKNSHIRLRATVPKPDVFMASESEGEEGTTEAERDARVAFMRSITPVPRAKDTLDDDASITSGDESDDADLDDADSVDSFWSDLDESDPQFAEKHTMLQYSRLTRRYTARFLGGPSSWERGPFTLTHECRLWDCSELHSGETCTDSTNPRKSKTPLRPLEGTSTVLIRFASRQGIEIRLTPLIISWANFVLDPWSNSALSHELRLDSLLAGYISELSSMKEHTTTLFDVAVASIRVKAMQSGLRELQEPTSAFAASSIETILAQLTIRDLTLTGGTVDKAYLTKYPSVDAGFSNCSLSFFGVPSPKHGHFSLFKKLPLRVILSDFSFSRNSGVNSLRWAGVAIEMDHLGPECARVLLQTAVTISRQIGETLGRWKARLSHSTEHLLQDVLLASSGVDIIDPLSTIQPLYLVQSGRPNDIRTNPTLRFLFHLRHSLTTLQARPLKSEYNGYDSLVTLIKTRLASLAPDLDNEYDTPLTLLSSSTAKQPKLPKTSSKVARWFSLEGFDMRLNIFNDVHTSSTDFTLSSVYTSIGLRHLDVIQAASTNVPTFSQTSLRTTADYVIQKLTISVALGDITCILLPDVLNFAQQLVRTHRTYVSSLPVQGQSPTVTSSPSIRADDTSTKRPTKPISVDFTMAMSKLRVQAIAATLVVEVGIDSSRLSLSSLSRTKKLTDVSMTYNGCTDTIFLRAISKTDHAHRRNTSLAIIESKEATLSTTLRLDSKSENVAQVLFRMKALHLRVPKSALRLYRFAEDWRNDFLPGIEAMVQALLSEVESGRTKAKPAQAKAKPRQLLQVQVRVSGRLDSVGIFLQVMRGTWVAWEAKGTTLYAQSYDQSIGLYAQNQVFSIDSGANTPRHRHSRVKLELPALTLKVKREKKMLHLLAMVDLFRAKIKPSHWDALLSVQQKFGRDFNELMQLVQETHAKRTSTSTKVTKPSTPAPDSEPYRALLKIRMKGFWIALEGVSSIVSLECDDIGGQIGNHPTQKGYFELSDLALSLAPRTAHDIGSSFNRANRTAFVTIDLRVDVEGNHDDYSSRVSVTKVHAVMQPIAIGQFGDFIDHIQTEMMERKEQRAVELAAFKEKTKSVMKTFESKSSREIEVIDHISWLEKMNIDVRIENIGVAFPLTINQSLEIPREGSMDSTAVRAFLFSTVSLFFSSNKGATGTADMRGFSFQFVPYFRQSVSSDYSGENHSTNNRLVYPKMKAKVRFDKLDSASNIAIDSEINGFFLDLDASLPDYVFSLIDVYQEGKERVGRIGESLSWSNDASPAGPETPRRYTATPNSTMLLSLVFSSGELRMHSHTATTSRRRKVSRTYDYSEDILHDDGIETFRVPEVSVWGEYRASSALGGPAHEAEPSILMFKSTIHSSENTFRPTILPFITDIMHRVETRLRQASKTRPRSYHSIPTPVSPTELFQPDDASTPQQTASSLQISFSLRIDQSRLQLNCQPDVNVVAGLHWNSGGFMVNVSPGARQVTLTGSVGGLTAGLKHGFLSEDCVRIDARNLAFSVNFSKSDPSTGSGTSSVSVVLDTEFSGLARFSRLQDVLCFKAVWLDRIPIFNANVAEPRARKPSLSSQPSSTAIPTAHNKLTTVLLARVRRISLEVDMGQSITAISLDINNGIMRTKLSEEAYEFTMTVAEVKMLARGNVSGRMEVPNFIFNTIRRREGRTLDPKRTKLLELSMTSGALTLELESDHQPILQYHAEPLQIEAYDDWSSTSLDHLSQDQVAPKEERPLQVAFLVSGTEIVAAITVGAIPRLLSYFNKFKANLEAQREGASLESKAFRITRTPKPDNPLSDVANAMLHSARTRFKEDVVNAGLEHVIRQRMSLKLELLRLAVFPRTISDHEIAQLLGKDVQAVLVRVVDGGGIPPVRDLSLAFSSMAISRFSQLQSPSGIMKEEDTIRWLNRLLKTASEANIIGLPSMKMEMTSEEEIQSPTADLSPAPQHSKTLLYDFDSRFLRNAEGKHDSEDIYITLNVALYSWLTILRKNFTREMGQVRAVEDWRTATSTAVGIAGANATALGVGSPTVLGGSLTRKGPGRSRGATLISSPLSGTSDEDTSTPKSPPPAAEASSPPTQAKRAPAIATSPSAGSNPKHSPQINITQPNGQGQGTIPSSPNPSEAETSITYKARSRRIERLTMRQLGEATPDVMHPFFMKTAGFNLEDALPQYVHEYATRPLEEIMDALLKLYTRQLLSGGGNNTGGSVGGAGSVNASGLLPAAPGSSKPSS